MGGDTPQIAIESYGRCAFQPWFLGCLPRFSGTNPFNPLKMARRWLKILMMTSNLSCMVLCKGKGLPHRLPQHCRFQATAMLLQTKSGLERSRWSSPQIIPGSNRLKLITLDAVPLIIMYLSGEAQGIKHPWTGRTALRKLRTSWLAHHKVAFRELLPSQNKYGLKKMPFQTATASSSDSPESSDQPRRIWNSCPKCSCSANILISRISAIPVRKLVEHPSKKRTSRCWIDAAMAAQGPQLLECYIWLHSNLWQLLPWLYRLYPYPNCRIKYWLPFINITRGVHATLRVFKINTSLIVHFFLILSFPHSLIPKG